MNRGKRNLVSQIHGIFSARPALKIREPFCESLPIFRRRYAVLFFKGVFKIIAVGKAAPERNLRHGVGRGNKFKRGALQSYKGQVFVHAYARRLAEFAA